MLRFVFGLFMILHGLVHLWFFTLSHGLIKYQPGMREPGWTGKSWLFTGLLGDSNTRLLASVLFVTAAVAFVVSGLGIFFRAEWWSTALIGSALFSSVIILILWDGSLQFAVDKGVIGLLTSLAILVVLLLFKRPTFAF